MSADVRVAPLRRKESAVGGEEGVPVGGAWDHREGVAEVVLHGEAAAGLERADELLQVPGHVGEEEEDPAREDDVVAGGGEIGVRECALPDRPLTEAVARAGRGERRRERRRMLHGVGRTPQTAAELGMKGAASRTDFEDA